jgi:hypothetical protein
VHKHADCVVMRIETSRLHERFSVPIDADGSEIASLVFTELGARRDAVKILEAKHEPRVCRAGAEPGDQCGAEVADVKVTGGRWSKATGRHLTSQAPLQGGHHRRESSGHRNRLVAIMRSAEPDVGSVEIES